MLEERGCLPLFPSPPSRRLHLSSRPPLLPFLRSRRGDRGRGGQKQLPRQRHGWLLQPWLPWQHATKSTVFHTPAGYESWHHGQGLLRPTQRRFPRPRLSPLPSFGPFFYAAAPFLHGEASHPSLCPVHGGPSFPSSPLFVVGTSTTAWGQSYACRCPHDYF